MNKKTDKQYSRTFGLEPILEPGQSKQDYVKLRQLWYKKAEETGLLDIESFSSFSTGQVTSFLRGSSDSASLNPGNYNICLYYDYLTTFKTAIPWLKSNQTLCKSYKIYRFFAHIDNISLDIKRDMSNKFKPLQPNIAAEAANTTQDTATSATNTASEATETPQQTDNLQPLEAAGDTNIEASEANSRTFNVNYALNTYILQAIIDGVSLRSLLKYLRLNKLPNNKRESTQLQELCLDKRLQAACVNLKLGMLHQRVRLIHECCFQYLVASGLADLNELQYLDLLGLDNPLIQLEWQATSDTELKFRSVVDKHYCNIY